MTKVSHIKFTEHFSLFSDLFLNYFPVEFFMKRKYLKDKFYGQKNQKQPL